MKRSVKIIFNWVIGFLIIFILDYLIKYSLTTPNFLKVKEVFNEIIVPFIVLIIFIQLVHVFLKIVKKKNQKNK